MAEANADGELSARVADEVLLDPTVKFKIGDQSEDDVENPVEYREVCLIIA